VVLARGSAEVRAFLVTGAAPGTPVRVTGWAPRDGVRTELLPAVALDGELTGATDDGDTLFVALARLTGDADAVPLGESVTVRALEEGELTVAWSEGPELRVRLDGSGVGVIPVD
jgi:hypothetical protein